MTWTELMLLKFFFVINFELGKVYAYIVKRF